MIDNNRPSLSDVWFAVRLLVELVLIVAIAIVSVIGFAVVTGFA